MNGRTDDRGLEGWIDEWNGWMNKGWMDACGIDTGWMGGLISKKASWDD